jgi:hypothetical protein
LQLDPQLARDFVVSRESCVDYAHSLIHTHTYILIHTHTYILIHTHIHYTHSLTQVSLESHRDMFRNLLRYKEAVAYYEVFYEQLQAKPGAVAHANGYWRALLAFLGARNTQSVRADTLQRMHPGTCRTKIKNWQEVRTALRGTVSGAACDWGRNA